MNTIIMLDSNGGGTVVPMTEYNCWRDKIKERAADPEVAEAEIRLRRPLRWRDAPKGVKVNDHIDSDGSLWRAGQLIEGGIFI